MIDLLKWLLSPHSFVVATIPTLVLVLLVAALVISSLGWIRLVYFISIGYGYSVAALMFLTTLVWDGPFWGRMTALILLAYGLRLGTYLWIREFQVSYQGEREAVAREYPGRTILRKLAVWLGVSVLYVVMVSPVVFHLQAGALADGGWLSVMGTWIALLGLVVEAVADFQKSRWKKTNPEIFCSSGLYRLVRFPNYFGEILVWAGAWVGAIPFYGLDPWRWGSATLGLVLIILIMLGSARRLEINQEKKYGLNRNFQIYCRQTPVLFPLVPLKSLKNLKVYLG